jgi:hypothetical protein
MFLLAIIILFKYFFDFPENKTNMKGVLAVLVALIILLSPNGIMGKELEKVFVSYSLSDSNDTPRLIKEVKTGEELLQGDYTIKAGLSFKSEKKDVLFKSLNFEPPGDNRFSAEQLQQGWTSSGKTYSWNPGIGENVLTIPLSSKLIDKNTSITDFEELHLDYDDLISQNPSLLNLKFNVSWEESEKDKARIKRNKLINNQATVIIDGKQLRVFKSLNLPSNLWQVKSLSYLTKRAFELPHDSSWNYIRKSKYFFFQNRFHLNLNDVETVDIHFKTNASQEKINSLNCNLRIGFESLLTPTYIRECTQFPKKIFRSNGNIVLRIWVGDLLRSKFLKKEKAYLDEIIFRIPQKKFTNIQEQPVAFIQFRSLYQPEIPKKVTNKNDSEDLEIKNQIFHFQNPITSLSSKRKRLIFPLDKLVTKIGRTGKIINITLSIQPEHWDTPAEFLLQRLRLVSHVSKESPAILNIGKELSARWGGPFFEQEENSEKIEWIKVRNFFSFNAPNTNQGHNLTTALKGNEQGESNLDVTSDPPHIRGIKIQGQNGLNSWHANKDGLRLEGDGDWVEIDWPMQENFDKNTWFFMDFGAGKENILDLKIKPFTESGELSSISTLPNKPERLKGISEKVKKLKIRIFLHSSPFNIQLKEMAVFHPLLLKQSSIFDSPTLIEQETLLIPKNVQTRPPGKVTIFKGHLSAPLWPQKKGISNELSWKTEVGRRVNRVQGLKIMYKVPSTMHVNNPCWLHFTLVSTKHEVNQTVCSEDTTNKINFSTDKLFHGIDIQNDEILKHISWKILAKNRVNLKTQPLPIDFSASLIGYDIRTIRSDFLSHPIVEWNGSTLFPGSIERLSKEGKNSKNFMTSLGVVSIKDKSETNPFLILLNHPHFQINSINLEKEEPISADDWALLSKKEPVEVMPSEKNQETYSPLLIFFSILAGGLLLIWRQKGRLYSIKWLIELSPDLFQKQIRFWLYISTAHYLLGLIFSLIKLREISDIFLTLASLAILLAWRSFVWKIRPDLEFRHPEIAAGVFRGAGGPYIAGFILTLMMMAFFLIIRLEPVAEQIAVVGYFMLVVSVFLEAKQLRNQNYEYNGDDETKSKKEDASRA